MLDLLRPHLRSVSIEAYSDYQDQMPADAAAAEAMLKDLGGQPGKGDPRMGVELDPSLEEHWVVLRAYAPWSINGPRGVAGAAAGSPGCFDAPDQARL